MINIRKSSNVNVISTLKNSDGALTSDPVVIANVFNKFFVNVSHDITKKIPRTRKSPLDFISNSICDSFFIAPSASSEISDIINMLKSGKSLGLNSIPIKLLKHLCPLISLRLSQIINESFQSDIFPDKMKLAKVIPLFKKGCSVTASNYRPISLLSVFSKVERVVAPWCNPLTLQPKQSGGVGSSPGRAPPLERHDKGSRTGLGLLYFCDPSAWR